MVHLTFWQYVRFRLGQWWRFARWPLCALGRHAWLLADSHDNLCVTCRRVRGRLDFGGGVTLEGD